MLRDCERSECEDFSARSSESSKSVTTRGVVSRDFESLFLKNRNSILTVILKFKTSFSPDKHRRLRSIVAFVAKVLKTTSFVWDNEPQIKKSILLQIQDQKNVFVFENQAKNHFESRTEAYFSFVLSGANYFSVLFALPLEAPSK